MGGRFTGRRGRLAREPLSQMKKQIEQECVSGDRRPAAQQKSTVLYNPDAPLEPERLLTQLTARQGSGGLLSERIDCGRRVPRMGGCE